MPNLSDININLSNLSETQLKKVISDLKELQEEYRVAASNEHLWGLGSLTQISAVQHELYADENRATSNWYGALIDKIIQTMISKRKITRDDIIVEVIRNSDYQYVVKFSHNGKVIHCAGMIKDVYEKCLTANNKRCFMQTIEEDIQHYINGYNKQVEAEIYKLLKEG